VDCLLKLSRELNVLRVFRSSRSRFTCSFVTRSRCVLALFLIVMINLETKFLLVF